MGPCPADARGMPSLIVLSMHANTSSVACSMPGAVASVPSVDGDDDDGIDDEEDIVSEPDPGAEEEPDNDEELVVEEASRAASADSMAAVAVMDALMYGGRSPWPFSLACHSCSRRP